MSTSVTASYRINNFDLIRLFAAFQVALHHTQGFLNTHERPVFTQILGFLALFPGVPIFFFFSGFLVSKSYENNPSLYGYWINRTLRIYPALIFCMILSVSSVYWSGYFAQAHFSWGEFILWVGGQLSFFQFYNPDFMRNYGVGVLNGSLWTISVELQFYFLIPGLYWLLNRVKKDRQHALLLGLIAIFMVINLIYTHFLELYGRMIIIKFISVSFLPYFYMFLIGVYFQKNFDFFHKIFQKKTLILLLVYLLCAEVGKSFFQIQLVNNAHPLIYLALVPVIFSLAYHWPQVSKKILKNNDISYGIYIYHMPLVNLFLYYFQGNTHDLSYFFGVILMTVLLAILSWIFIEKPAMHLKRSTLRR